jgi:hypothetical protein
MTGKFTPVVLFIYRKEITSQMINVAFDGHGCLQWPYKISGQDETNKLFNLT